MKVFGAVDNTKSPQENAHIELNWKQREAQINKGLSWCLAESHFAERTRIIKNGRTILEQTYSHH